MGLSYSSKLPVGLPQQQSERVLPGNTLCPIGYLNDGRWEEEQLVPSSNIDLIRKPSPYNPHSPYSLQFEVNEDGHVDGAPRDAYFKSGGPGYCLYVVPSLDMVIYKMSSRTAPNASQGSYDLGFAETQEPFVYDGSREDWEFAPFDQFHDGRINGDAGTRRLLELVVASVVD
jgi:hypothetical protein